MFVLFSVVAHFFSSSLSQSVAGHVGGPHLCNPNSTEYDLAMKDQSWSLLSVSHPKNGFKVHCLFILRVCS